MFMYQSIFWYIIIKLDICYFCSILKVTRMSRICDFSSVVSLDHNELWRLPAANKLYMTSQMLWPLATMNCRIYVG